MMRPGVAIGRARRRSPRLYGAWLLLEPAGHDLPSTPVALAGRRGRAARRRAGAAGAGGRGGRRAAAAAGRRGARPSVGFVVLGSVTLLAMPVLGRFGARPDNPTLLDRDYSVGLAGAGRRWSLVAAWSRRLRS